MERKGIQPQLRNLLNSKAMKSRIPLNGSFELTPRCNMNCKMCYIRMSREEMDRIGRERSAEEWIRMGRICKEQGMLFLLLTGGEPFLREDFREIYTELNKMGLLISINSNGTMITEETVEWLRQMPPSKINITLYGGSNETYEKLCRNSKGFDQVTQAIDLLLGAGINVGINISFTPDNVEDMDAIYRFAKERKIPCRSAVYMFPPVRKANPHWESEDPRFSPEEAGKVLFYAKKNEMGDRMFSEFLKQVEQGTASLRDDADEECGYQEGGHMDCIAGRSSFGISWDGKMTPCGMMVEPVAYPFEDGFENCWKKICKGVDEIVLPSECAECKNRFACKLCGAVAKAEGEGDSTKKPEYLCGMTEACLEFCRKQSGDKNRS